jgi:hypothetical protein
MNEYEIIKQAHLVSHYNLRYIKKELNAK